MSQAKRRKDGYPTAKQALTQVAEEIAEAEEPAHQINVQLLASGEVTYRVHLRGVQEVSGGYIPPSDSR